MPYAELDDGVRLFYEESGRGAPVVFVHAYLGRADVWAGQRIALSTRFRTLAYDARGHGRSDAPREPAAYGLARSVRDLVAILDHASMPAAHLVGLSMGADVVLHALLDYPERVRSAVLADIGMGADDPAWLESWSEAVARSFVEDGSAATYDRFLAESPLVAGVTRARPRAAEGMRQLVASQPAHAMGFTLRGIVTSRPSLYALGERLSTLEQRVLVIRGENDTMVVKPSAFLVASLPHATLVVLPGVSHVTNIQAPTAFNEALLAFFEG